MELTLGSEKSREIQTSAFTRTTQMQSLLRWAVENSSNDGSGQPPHPRQPLDPAIIDHILGKPDAVLMKEALAVALDETRGDDDRVAALDDLEMLIENIDNANDLEKLKMWTPLHDLLTSPSSDAIKTQTLWVIGTAVQNNPSAQNAYLSVCHLPDLLALLSSSSNSPQTRSKAVYALSGILKHNLPAVEEFAAADGWPCLCNALQDSDITVRRKVVFLINTLLVQTSLVGADGEQRQDLHAPASRPGPIYANSHAPMLSNPRSTETSAATFEALRLHGLLEALISALITPMPHGADGDGERDVDIEEKIIRVLQTYSNNCGGQFSADEKRDLQSFFDTEGDASGEKWGISPEEMKALKLAIS